MVKIKNIFRRILLILYFFKLIEGKLLNDLYNEY